jgi:hypothetical protein
MFRWLTILPSCIQQTWRNAPAIRSRSQEVASLPVEREFPLPPGRLAAAFLSFAVLVRQQFAAFLRCRLRFSGSDLAPERPFSNAPARGMGGFKLTHTGDGGWLERVI